MLCPQHQGVCRGSVDPNGRRNLGFLSSLLCQMAQQCDGKRPRVTCQEWTGLERMPLAGTVLMNLLDRLVLQWDILGLGPEPEVSSEGKKARDLSRFHSTTR